MLQTGFAKFQGLYEGFVLVNQAFECGAVLCFVMFLGLRRMGLQIMFLRFVDPFFDEDPKQTHSRDWS